MTNDKKISRAYGIFGSVDLGNKGPNLFITGYKTCLFSGKFRLDSKTYLILGPFDDAFARIAFAKESNGLDGRMLEDGLRFHVVGEMDARSLIYTFDLLSKSNPLVELAKWKGILKYRGINYKARCTTQPLSEDGLSALI